ncbi:hypothetical protein [Nonomuraea sp. KM90]|uniref:hypothetical protein n=1 Tax=Nonomuraea sp. KM90 TaxID=3457428 RepID=UPI003FCC767A
MRYALRGCFPAALTAFDDLDVPEAFGLLERPADPAAAAKPAISQIGGALTRVGRRGDLAAKAAPSQAALRTEQLGRSAAVAVAYPASIQALIAVPATLNQQGATLHTEVEAPCGQPAAEMIASQPGLGPILGTRGLADLCDDPQRYAAAKARKNHARTSPITRARGTTKAGMARHVRGNRPIDALMAQVATVIRLSPGARAPCARPRARDSGHNAALRQVANRLVGALHGCLKIGTVWDEATAWSHREESPAA